MIIFFFFNDTAPTEIYTYGHTLSLHDALPISGSRRNNRGDARLPGTSDPPAAGDQVMAQTTADYMLSRLAAWGVKRIYGYPGDGINGILGALGRAGDAFEFVQSSEERRGGKGCVRTCRSRWSPDH